MTRSVYKAVRSSGSHHCLSRNISRRERKLSHRRVRIAGKKAILEQVHG